MNKIQAPKEVKRKRAPTKYWVEIKGSLYARLQYKAESGKYQVKYQSIRDKRTAKRVVDEMRRELEVHGEETLLSDKMTFRELSNLYTTAKLNPAVFENEIKISGRKTNISWILKSLVEYFDPKKIRSIKPRDLEAFKNFKLNSVTRRGNKRAIASVNRELEVLRAMLNFALQNEWIIKNPFTLTKGVISKAAEAERDRILSFDEETRLLSACTDKRTHLKPILICALDTAMRRGEIFKMRWKDVKLETGEIFIPLTNTKTEESRIVGITPRLRVEFEKLWAKSPQDKNGTVFGIVSTIKTAFGSACKEAAIDDFRFHDCRHTATTRMIASGSPHTEVMKITGHSQLVTFLRYLNITSETANKVASTLGNYLENHRDSITEVSTTVK